MNIFAQIYSNIFWYQNIRPTLFWTSLTILTIFFVIFDYFGPSWDISDHFEPFEPFFETNENSNIELIFFASLAHSDKIILFRKWHLKDILIIKIYRKLIKIICSMSQIFTIFCNIIMSPILALILVHTYDLEACFL